ncbi:MAG TPA: hypothetical protein VEY11_03490 [Pyrinomonadaceae bacterium]|nr:hypothetical protein [Pyrinomonadaceae bacterium]
MNSKLMKKIAGMALACLFVFGMQSIAVAQGRGGGGRGAGNSGAGGAGRGGGGGIGRPDGVGVDRGIGTSSDRSRGRADEGRGTASERSRGRSDEGLERARAARDNNSRRAAEELREHPGIATHLNTAPGRLRDEYQAALATNPDLKFGQFVAATVLARNLGDRNPAITRSAILEGLANDKSIGRTLRDLGINERQAREAERQANRELKESKKRSS